MTANEIVNEFAAEVNRLCELLQECPENSLDTVEQMVGRLVRQVGRQLVSALFEQVLDQQRRPLCPVCGAPMRGHGRRPRTFATLLGDVTVHLPRFRCAPCGQESVPGLALCAARRCCTRELWQVAVELAVELPYRTVERLLGRLGIPLSDSSSEALVRELGEELEAAEGGAEVVELVPPAERMYLLVDGRSVRVDGEWRELKVGVIFVTRAAEPDAQGRWPAVEQLSSYAAVANADEFMAQFLAEARRRGLWSAREVVLLADGANWIWERLPQFVLGTQERVEILDLYHAAEHVRGAVDAACGAGSERARRWSEHLREQLRAGQWPAVVKDLRRLREQATAAESRHRVQLSLDYLERHRERIEYFLRHWQGYYIGSGQVESVCKQLGQRFKGCGMNWSAAGLRHLLAVYNHLHRWPRQPLPRAA